MPAGADHFGLDLHVDLDGGRGRRVALEDAVREAIRAGRLRPGTRMPSSRALAGDLGVARATVTGAYAQLVSEGWLTARRGSGTVVADLPAGLRGQSPQSAFVVSGLRGRSPQSEVRPGGQTPQSHHAPPWDWGDRPPGLKPLQTGGVSSAGGAEVRLGGQTPQSHHDLRAGFPDVGAFPRSAWGRALRRALADAPDAALLDADPRGSAVLRAELAAYLARARGVVADPDAVVVCGGVAHGLRLLAGVLAAGGASRLALEDPCVPDHRRLVAAAGLEVVPVPVDADGARLDGVDAAAAVLTPAHQFPLGVTLAPARRAAALRWAAERDALLVEDDYDGEFRFDRTAVGALQARDPARVVFAGTVSKALAPGLRLGWLVLPPALVEPVAEARRLGGGGPPVLDQLAFAAFLRSADHDRHVRRMRAAYRARRDALLETVARRAPAVGVQGIAAGLSAVLVLPPGGPSEREVRAAAAARGLALDGLRPFRHAPRPATQDDGPAEALVVGFATPPAHAWPAALRTLGDVLAETCGGA